MAIMATEMWAGFKGMLEGAADTNEQLCKVLKSPAEAYQSEGHNQGGIPASTVLYCTTSLSHFPQVIEGKPVNHSVAVPIELLGTHLFLVSNITYLGLMF